MDFNSVDNFLNGLNDNPLFEQLFSYNNLDKFHNTEYSVYLGHQKLLLKLNDEFISINLNDTFNIWFRDQYIQVLSLDTKFKFSIKKTLIDSFYLHDVLMQSIHHLVLKNSISIKI